LPKQIDRVKEQETAGNNELKWDNYSWCTIFGLLLSNENPANGMIQK
jgi:hypothetical protein